MHKNILIGKAEGRNHLVNLGAYARIILKLILEKWGIIRLCIQKFPDLLPGVRIANGTALCH
jgi:hypothetical protein